MNATSLLTNTGYEDRPLREALKTNSYGFDFDIRWGGNFKSYVQFSEYSKYLPMWREIFGYENILIVSSDRLAREPDKELSKVWKFLGLSAINTGGAIASNRTSALGNEKLPAWLTSIAGYVPQVIRTQVVNSPQLMKLLRNTLSSDSSVSPVFNDQDVRLLSDILQNEILFYNKVLSE